MRKAVYLLFLFASFVASGLGLNKSEALATSSITNDSALTTSDSGKLYFSDLIEGHNGSGLIAAHYSHRSHGSHGSHGSHQSHYSSRY